jgi:hypothetical protein
MSQVKTILILAFLVLSFLISVPGESPSGELHLRQASAANTEGHTTEAEHALDPIAWRYAIKNVAKRRIDTSVLPFVIHNFITHPGDHVCGRSSHFSGAIVSRVTPLYQSLQVYRF